MQSKDKKYRIGSLVAGALLVVIIGIVFVRFSDDQAITDTGRNSAIKPLESGSLAAGGPGQDIEPPTENANLQTMFAAEQAAAETEPVPETMTALAELMDEVQALRAEVRALNDKIDRLSAPPEQKPGPDRPERVAATAALSRGRYVVQRGDTLSGIAERHDLRTGCLIAWNNIPRPDEIQAGRRLSLSGDADCIPFQEWIKATRIPSSEIARSGQSAGQTKTDAGRGRRRRLGNHGHGPGCRHYDP